MKGYHYTSWENWQKIKKEGLRPYLIDHPDIKELVPKDIYGIFTWRENHKGMAHIGNLIFQMTSKSSTRIVKLSYNYEEGDIYRYDGGKVSVKHSGTLVNCTGRTHKEVGLKTYHSKHKAWILVGPISSYNISLEGDYDLLKLLK